PCSSSPGEPRVNSGLRWRTLPVKRANPRARPPVRAYKQAGSVSHSRVGLRSGLGGGCQRGFLFGCARFGAVCARFGAIRARFGAFRARFGAIRARFGAVRARFGAVRARIRAQLVRWWLNNVTKPPNPPKLGHIVNPHLIMWTSCTRSGRFVT